MYLAQEREAHVNSSVGTVFIADRQGVGVTWCICLATEHKQPYSIDNTASADAISLYLFLSLHLHGSGVLYATASPVAHTHCVLRDSTRLPSTEKSSGPVRDAASGGKSLA